ncbi:MAG: CCA tRNA nucleotidyltransferase [Alphaproteobacteria bacterium]|nr:CCA tRNA nucleotidyltransferase [Alphaproteobacteria bacterium]
MLDPRRDVWLSDPETLRVLDALEADGGEARFVGGAVRNAILRRDVDEIDIATPLPPSDVIGRLEAKGIRAVPTGLEHGTVTAITGNKSFEITTLRRDLATDGRHALVAFSNDWKEDAARRDFSMNALYATRDGQVFDYFGGVEDAKAGRVRFIGDASARIREDYLRILRLFRFHAWYGKGDIAPQEVRAAATQKAGLAKLSGERIQAEMLKLLCAEDPAPVLRTMAAAGILGEVLPGDLSIPSLARLAEIDAESFFPSEGLLRLSALVHRDPRAVAEVCERWKLSNAARERLCAIAGARVKIASYLSVRELHKILYRIGVPLFRDLVFMHWAGDPKISNGVRWRTLLAQAESWQRPRFPLSGRDVMLAGVPEGPLIGKILAEVEEWWVDADFIEDEFSLAERLKAVVQAIAY